MPGFDGKGPQGRGPMTGRGMGFCVLKESGDKSGPVQGLVGIQGTLVNNLNQYQTYEKEVINMPRGDGTGPQGLGTMTGRAAGYCAGYGVPGYINPVAGRGQTPAGFFGPRYEMRYGRGRGFGRGFGRGRRRGGFGRWW